MSIKELMEDVREGKFESKFKNCTCNKEKIELFQEYGIYISEDQYRDIQCKVSSIKKGKGDNYNYLQDNTEGKKTTRSISETESMKVCAGYQGQVDYKNDLDLVLDLLKRMPEESLENNEKFDQDDMWEIKPFLTDRGMF